MEPNGDIIAIDSFMSYTIGIVVYLAGVRLNGHIPILREYNIPDPVAGGLVVALGTLALYLATGLQVHFSLETRDLLLVYFFTTIGLNSRISDLIAGGRTLAILLALTLSYIVFQDTIGVLAARAIGQPTAMGVLTGSAALIGGHGTAIAWAPEIAAEYGVPNALEVGVGAATLGLVLGATLGGPMGKWLLSRMKSAEPPPGDLVVGIHHEKETTEQIDHTNIMVVFLVVHLSIILGWILNEEIGQAGLRLPLFVSCLVVGIVLSNTVPFLLPNTRWPARTKALALVSDFSLQLFLAMSLMSMQLWALADLAGPLLILLAAQVLAVVVFIAFVLFPLMGRDYLAAVLGAGFAGFALGATPTAVANMTAVAKSHGPAPQAFIILPLVGAFFVDITNAFVIQFFLTL